MNRIEIVACMGSQNLVFPPIMQENGGGGSIQLKCQKQGQNTQAQCTLNKPIFCPNNGEGFILMCKSFQIGMFKETCRG